MSGAAAAAARKGIGTRLAHAMLLLFFGALLFVVTRRVPEVHGGLWTITAVGFLLLAGTLTSELLDIFRLPHLTAYLIAGIVAGPHVLRLVDAGTVDRLSPVNALALALIALAGGAELEIGAVRRALRGIAWSSVLQTLVVFFAMAGAFIAMRPVLPFARRMPLGVAIAVSLLWGVCSLGRSPSALLAILSETRAKGQLAEFTLALVMISDVIVVIVLAVVTTIVRPLLDPTASFSLESFAALGHELFGSVALGTTLGLFIAAYLRLVGRQMLVVLLVLGFGLTEVLRYLQFEPLLTFMVAGFIVRNMSRQGEKFVRSIEETGGVVYVVFFATTGASLDLPLVRVLAPVAVAFVLVRTGATWIAARASSRIANDPPVVRRWAWSGLLSQAGLTLGLSALIEREFTAFGAPFHALVLAVVALNQLVGPVLFKLALDRAGETSRLQAPSLSSIRPPPMPG